MDIRRMTVSNSPIPSIEMTTLVVMGGNRWTGMHGETWHSSERDLPSEYVSLECRGCAPVPDPSERFTSSDALPPPPAALAVGVAGLVARLREWVWRTSRTHSSGEICTPGAR
ncbi:hypothetical protein GC173_02110 [bacterium]|nr:hypothetical protein [bacterium]